MTVVIASPLSKDATELAEAPVCGVPLLVRVLSNAFKAGATEVIVLERSPEQRPLLERVADHPVLAGRAITIVPAPDFIPERPLDWHEVLMHLPPVFVWLPWNLILSNDALKKVLADASECSTVIPLFARGVDPSSQVAVVRRLDVLAGSAFHHTPGDASKIARPNNSLLVTSPAMIPELERQIIRNSGKETDGLYSKMNRALCRPTLRLLCRTPVTANAITIIGLVLSGLSGYLFAQGCWSAYVAGALAYFACVLCDEMDGMLARIKFSESALGCWLETAADYVSYIFLFAGLTIGLYRENGVSYLWTGLAMIVGSALTMLVLSYQRKMITDTERPQEFRKRLQRTLDLDSSNPISWLGRNLEFMIRKPAYCYWVLLFCVLGIAKLLVILTAIGANVAWMMALSYNRLFRPIQARRALLGEETI